jgi:hypothetical protein
MVSNRAKKHGGDALQMNAAPLSTIRGTVPPSRNNLSHANKIRNIDI